MIVPRRPFQPVLRNSRCVAICLDRWSEQVTIPPRCGLPFPNTQASWPERDPWEWLEKPHSWYLATSKWFLDKHDTDPAFPSCLSQSRPMALSYSNGWRRMKNWLSRTLIREACLRAQDNLETAVKFLPRPRQPGLSLVGSLAPA